MLFGNSFMAGTKSTKAFTKRQMDVQTDATFIIAFFKTFYKRFLPLSKGKTTVIPIRHRWITGISWAGNIIFSNERVHFYNSILKKNGRLYKIRSCSENNISSSKRTNKQNFRFQTHVYFT
jgi:hypothetical protein